MSSFIKHAKPSRIVSCIAASLLAGCGSQDDEAVVRSAAPVDPESVELIEMEEQGEQGEQGEQVLGNLPTHVDSLTFHRRLADEFTKIDPQEEGWESEAFNEKAGAQMKEVAKLLVPPEDIHVADLELLIAADFTSGPLRSDDLSSVFDGPSMTVLRASDSAGPKGKEWKGTDGFVSALRSLASTLDGATQKRSNFKIMQVELKGEHFLTKMLFEMRGYKPAGWTQISATWHCEWTLTETPVLRSIQVSDYQEASPGSDGRIEFIDAAPVVLGGNEGYDTQLGREFDYWRARSDKSLVSDLLGRQGVIVGDVNGDGLDDVYVPQPGGLPNRLFIHMPDGTARDASAESGVDILDFCRSALLIDIDNDGDRDLAIGLAWKLMLMENDGSGHFTARGGYPSDGQVNSLAAADFDNDGDLDIYVCGQHPSGAIKAEQGVMGIPMPYYDANNGGPNTLHRNDGDFAFTDITKEVGMDVNNRRFSLACAWEDFDNDGDQDLYVANDFGRNNLFRNDSGPEPGSRIFTDIAPEADVEDIGPGMSAAWGDYNNDGLVDLYVANMWSNAGNRITLLDQFLPGATETTKKQARRHARGNSVYLNAGGGKFSDMTQSSGANMGRWAWSSNFIDLDNDGRQDLVVANGMLTTGDTGDL
jgi:hypothetical protein